ncbi:hypothetical protein GCM10010329_81160 [Streptomyces spiroverticillatus]|uniref:Uncharacterized protein n=1 Tax=Streptomyces finlayi TaxID=67296 RepID=A0A919CFN9_9ACTN|nr:hypothetical protein [Streptomyces finlayi]GHA46367.1 hypothetical protein GCM10010329_81160 [Streptomyces spiroverticillatus]GHD16334.1 hypothetical protein GCM10010334_77340 [Streptomyces finlayi]
MAAYAGFTSENDPSQRDVAVEALVQWCGWLFAAVFTIGFAHGWWWGGDLRNLPLIGDQVAQKAAAGQGFPEIPLLSMVLGAYWIRRCWLSLANRARGIDPRARRHKRGPKFPPNGNHS